MATVLGPWNNLGYQEQDGNWQAIFKKIPRDREFNYFSRGVIEIISESKQYPELAIEQNLALIYDRDFRFYLMKSSKNCCVKYKNVHTNQKVFIK